MHRKKLVAANWKMNLSPGQGQDLVKRIKSKLPENLNCEVIIAPPFVYIASLTALLEGSPIQSGAQHCHTESSGAFTGEISADMLSQLGVRYCLVGHSERRQLFQESNDFIRGKVDVILKNHMVPIFCCGEPLEIREKNGQNDFVRKQLEDSLFHLKADVIQQVVIAYEPIWAIGTGVTASPDQAQEMHAYIRSVLEANYGDQVSTEVRILYGGSIKADNAAVLFSQPDVDGGLVGGAALDPDGFLAIIQAGNS